ncbi:MAG: polyprenol phosphomannose-dependent alpha 1,6 mannosyltransferase MptB [Pseudonocardia sp.]
MATVPADETAPAGRVAADRPVPDGPGAADRVARTIRRFGLTGTLLMALGSLGAGALPVPNPLFGLRVLGLPIRNVTVALTITYAGMGMLVVAWLWLGHRLRAHHRDGAGRIGGRAVARTAALWGLPLAVAPPLFSTDVYTYLGQEAISLRGLDPYALGPAQALGVDDPLVRTIPTIWQNTPAPYGPLFLWVGRIMIPFAEDDLLLGVVAHRALALAGLGLIVWALLRLGRRFGADPAVVVWLGVANPMVLFHLVSGVHNEALMLGLMLAGLEIGLGRSWLAGAVLISAAAMVKLPAALALGFLGVALARRWGGPDARPWTRVRHVLAAAGLLGVVAAAVSAGIGWASGLGFGWVDTLGGPNAYRSLLSVTTVAGRLGGGLGVLAGLGTHTDAVLVLTRAIGGLLAGVIVVRFLLAALAGRVDPLAGLGAALGAAVLFAPVVHPWYLLWAVLPLAATTQLPRWRAGMVAASAVAAVLVPPTGADFNFRPYQLPMAILAGLAVLAFAVLLVRMRVRRPAPERVLEPA